MNSLFKSLACLLVLAALHAVNAADRHYAVVDYMHIPGNSSQKEYIALEKLWQRLHQKAVNSGVCRAWYLDRVENGGRNHFVTVRLYDSLDKMAEPWPDSIWQGLYNDQEMAIMRKTGSIRILTQSELWAGEAHVDNNSGPEKTGAVYVHFMKAAPGKQGAYAAMERDFYQKIHKSRIDAGQMKGWVFVSRMFPNGHDGEYDFVTLNLYSKDQTPSWDDKILEKALTKEERQKMPNAGELRTIVRQEIWHPILWTEPARKLADK